MCFVVMIEVWVWFVVLVGEEIDELCFVEIVDVKVIVVLMIDEFICLWD